MNNHTTRELAYFGTYCDIKEVLSVHIIGCSHLLVIDAVSSSKGNHGTILKKKNVVMAYTILCT